MWKMGLLAGSAALLWAGGAWAQEQRPIAPPPEHDVKRLGNTPEAVEPPSLPPDEIIRKFVAKEDEFASVRPTFAAKKTIRIDEYDHDGDYRRAIFAGVGSDADAGRARGE